MASATKLVGGTAGVLGGGSAVGYGVKCMFEMEPDYTLLSQVENFSGTYASGTFGASDNNKNLFVDPDNNHKWWEWAYHNRFNSETVKPLSPAFEKVKSSYSTTSEDALNKVCKASLVLQKSELVVISYKKDIWRYCSKSGQWPDDVAKKPSSTPYKGQDTNKFGLTTENREKFVDSNDTKNKEWWNWVYENVFKKDKTSKKDIHSSFNSVEKGYSSTDKDTKALNQVCKTAYEKKPATVANIKYKKNIWRYCAKDGRAPREINLDEPPQFITLSDKSKASTAQVQEKTKLGGVESNKSKLVADVSANEEGWNWIFENKLSVDKQGDKKSSLASEFSSITSGYSSSTSNTALNKVCAEATKKERTFLESNNNYKLNVETYCTNEKTKTTLTLPEAKTQTPKD